jgi:hypothetical protein
MTDNHDIDMDQQAQPPLPPPPPAEALTQEPSAGSAETDQRKSPPLAAVLSFVLPGLGHLYTETYQRSAMILASFGLAIWMVARWWPFVFVAVFLWFFGMFDSYREAQVINRGGEDPDTFTVNRGRGGLVFGAFLVTGGGVLLLDNLGLIDFDWFFNDWWPLLVVAAGLYFIVAGVRDRASS